MEEQKIGLYIPTEAEYIDCTVNNKSCEYGICSECSVRIKYSLENVENEINE